MRRRITLGTGATPRPCGARRTGAARSGRTARAHPPRGRFGCLWALGWALLRNAFAPTRGGPARRIAVGDFARVTLAGADRVALGTWWNTDLPDRQRSRERFRDLAGQAAHAVDAAAARAAGGALV